MKLSATGVILITAIFKKYLPHAEGPLDHGQTSIRGIQVNMTSLTVGYLHLD